MDDRFLNAEGRLMQFYQEHPGKGVADVNWQGKATGWRLFPDGAMLGTGGVMKEPPTDPFEAAKLTLKFHTIRLNLAVAAFNNEKHELIAVTVRSRMNSSPREPWPTEKAKLLELQKTALKLKCDVTRAQAKVDSYNHPPARREGDGPTELEGIATAREEIRSIEI